MRDQLLAIGFSPKGVFREILQGKMQQTGEILRCYKRRNLNSDDFEPFFIVLKKDKIFKLEIMENEDEILSDFSIGEIKQGFQDGFLS